MLGLERKTRGLRLRSIKERVFNVSGVGVDSRFFVLTLRKERIVPQSRLNNRGTRA